MNNRKASNKFKKLSVVADKTSSIVNICIEEKLHSMKLSIKYFLLELTFNNYENSCVAILSVVSRLTTAMDSFLQALTRHN